MKPALGPGPAFECPGPSRVSLSLSTHQRCLGCLLKLRQAHELLDKTDSSLTALILPIPNPYSLIVIPFCPDSCSMSDISLATWPAHPAKRQGKQQTGQRPGGAATGSELLIWVVLIIEQGFVGMIWQNDHK